MIVIIDYGMGNLNSIIKALDRIKVGNVKVSKDPRIIEKADKFILPGVGHFKRGMDNLKQEGLIEILNEQVLVKQKPILGICLGMQLLASFSEEGAVEGLNWIPGQVKKIPIDLLNKDKNRKLKVPHIGWNTIEFKNKSNWITDLPEDSSFYFVHSFYFECENREYAIGISEYGIPFDAMIIKNNIIGTQFHPEKSHKAGLLLLKLFSSI